ncbi:hypothetical protein B0I37DRAFT_4317 [Chaetomium sp. MPI-CAGE-AT-0009]|nr:hypothetical protein B0I37DRAFT_4317 [Chaetomium sp. MPI-CAGE-AT-0009]
MISLLFWAVLLVLAGGYLDGLRTDDDGRVYGLGYGVYNRTNSTRGATRGPERPRRIGRDCKHGISSPLARRTLSLLGLHIQYRM